MNRQILITLLLSIFIALLGIGIIIPVMPVFAAELGAGGFSLGMIIAAFSISRGVLQPVVGSLSDRWGRKGFLVAGLFIYGLVGLLIPQAGSVINLIAIRGFHGVGSAMIVPIAMAYMSYLAPAGHEGRYMSYLNIAIFCGIGCGPIIGGLFSDLFGFASVFYVMAALSFFAFVLVIINMPSEISVNSSNSFSLFKNISLMLKNRRTLGILTARFSTMIIMVPTMAFLPLLMTQRMSVSGLQIGFIIACRTLVNAVLQIPAGKYADTHNKLLLLVAGCICLSSSIVIIPFVESYAMMLVLYTIIGLGEAFIWPVLGAYASQEGREHYGHGTMMGVFSLAMSGGVFTGATLAGFSMDAWGIDWAFFTTSAAVFTISMIGAFLIYSNQGSNHQLKETGSV
jgi:DHA1 family multidrug resistance protein-like MFS transporter